LFWFQDNTTGRELFTKSVSVKRSKLPPRKHSGDSLDMSPILLGCKRCFAVPATARTTNKMAVATYAQPKKGFLPPIHETVEKTTDLVPENCRTG
jgi:hypothetical protein